MRNLARRLQKFPGPPTENLAQPAVPAAEMGRMLDGSTALGLDVTSALDARLLAILEGPDPGKFERLQALIAALARWEARGLERRLAQRDRPVSIAFGRYARRAAILAALADAMVG